LVVVLYGIILSSRISGLALRWMKKCLLFMIMLVYGLSSSGMSVKLYYCCGKLERITFSSKFETTCAGKEKTSVTECCDKKEVDLKVKADQEPTSKQVNFVSSHVITTAFQVTAQAVHLSEARLNPFGNGPPLSSPLPLFIKNSVFRI
jgi:hypothetical protein